MQANDNLPSQSNILSEEDLLEMERTAHKATVWFLSHLERTSANTLKNLVVSIEKAKPDQALTSSDQSTLNRIKVLIRPFQGFYAQYIYIKKLISISAKLMIELRDKIHSMSPDQQMIALLLTNKASGLIQIRLQSLIQRTSIPNLLIDSVNNLTLKDALEITKTKVVFSSNKLDKFNSTFLTKINLDNFFIPTNYLEARPYKTKKRHCMLTINYELIKYNESKLLEFLNINHSYFKKINNTILIAFEKAHHSTFKKNLFDNGITYSKNPDLISIEIVNKINFNPNFKYQNLKNLLTSEIHKTAQKKHRIKKKQTHKRKTILIHKKSIEYLQPSIDPHDEYYVPYIPTKASIILRLLYNFMDLSFKNQQILINTYHNKTQSPPKAELQKIDFNIELKIHSKLISICDRNDISLTKLVNILLFKEAAPIKFN